MTTQNETYYNRPASLFKLYDSSPSDWITYNLIILQIKWIESKVQWVEEIGNCLPQTCRKPSQRTLNSNGETENYLKTKSTLLLMLIQYYTYLQNKRMR